MPYEPIVFKNLPDTTTPLSAANLNHIQGQYPAAVVEAVRQSSLYTNSAISAIPPSDPKDFTSVGAVSVLSFGADPQGGQDSTLAIQSAADAVGAAGGGMLVFPPGSYRQDGIVQLSANTQVFGYGATILKTFGTSYGFSYIAFTALGGSGWTRNIAIYGLKFTGDLPSNGVMVVWGHRCQNLRVQDVTVEGATTNGHCLDLQGCTDVEVLNSSFSGAAPTPGREHAEAIQLDSSVAVGSPWKAISQVYDGTPSSRVSVVGNRFLGLSGFTAPRPFGSHSTVKDRYYTDIEFRANYIETPVVSSSWRSPINFVGVKRVVVNGNVFNITAGLSFPSMVGFAGVSTWILPGDVNNPDAVFQAATHPMTGDTKSVSGNNVPPSYTASSGDFESLSYTASFQDYSAGTSVRLYVSPTQVDMIGVIGRTDPAAPSADISSSTEVTAATLSPHLRPKRTIRVSCPGSASDTWMITVHTDGNVTASRYSTPTRTNPYLPVSLSWQRS